MKPTAYDGTTTSGTQPREMLTIRQIDIDDDNTMS